MMEFYYCTIYRCASGADCTNGGISSRFKHAVLWRKAAPAEYPLNAAVFELDDTPIRFGKGEIKRVRAVPAGETRWCMFGGNFLWSSDSRFREEVSERPIPIHDRIEG